MAVASICASVLSLLAVQRGCNDAIEVVASVREGDLVISLTRSGGRFCTWDDVPDELRLLASDSLLEIGSESSSHLVTRSETSDSLVCLIHPHRSSEIGCSTVAESVLFPTGLVRPKNVASRVTSQISVLGSNLEIDISQDMGASVSGPVASMSQYRNIRVISTSESDEPFVQAVIQAVEILVSDNEELQETSRTFILTNEASTPSVHKLGVVQHPLSSVVVTPFAAHSSFIMKKVAIGLVSQWLTSTLGALDEAELVALTFALVGDLTAPEELPEEQRFQVDSLLELVEEEGSMPADRAAKRWMSLLMATKVTAPILRHLVPARDDQGLSARLTEFRHAAKQDLKNMVRSYVESEARLRTPAVSASFRRVDEAQNGLEFVADFFGYIEDCGCKSSSNGGIKRLAKRWRALKLGVPRISLGNMGSVPSQPNHAVGLNDLVNGVLLRSGVQAIVPGYTELWQLASQETAPIGDAYVSCNVVNRQGAYAFSPYIDLEWDGTSVRLVGVSGLWGAWSTQRHRELISSAFDVLNPIRGISEIANVTPASRRLLICGQIHPLDIAEIAAAVPSNAVIVTARADPPRWNGALSSQVDGTIGGVSVCLSDMHNYGVLQVQLNGSDLRLSRFELTDGVTVADEDAEIRHFLEGGQQPIELEFSEPLLTPDNSYVGARSCQTCHDREFHQWQSTRHADSLRPLISAQRHRVPNCVACHVVGFGKPSGFSSLGDDQLSNVGCEVCHGPGSRHVGTGGRFPMRSFPTTTLCASCHTVEHSDFLKGRQDAYFAKVKHSAK